MMNAKQIFEQLLACRKVGESDSYYVYLNVDGNLVSSREDVSRDSPGNMLSNIIYYGTAKVIPEDGP